MSNNGDGNTLSAIGPQPLWVQRKHAVFAASIGNVLEWYDFSVYVFFAPVISRKFFPHTNPLSALMEALAVFGLGFIVRPLGALFFGKLADRKGRKAALTLTIVLMAVGTLLIGLVPSFAVIGVIAPLALVGARLLQGFSAGGEWGGATTFLVEWSPSAQRGLYGSFNQVTVVVGMLLGSAGAALINTMLSPAASDLWGWRLAFILGGLLGPVGFYIRKHVGETPVFLRAQEPVAPLGTASNLARIACASGFTVLWTVSYYILLDYMPVFLRTELHISRRAALWSNSAGLLVLIVTMPLMGALSDRIGRKPLLLSSCIAFAVLSYPLLRWMTSGVPLEAVVGVQILFALLISMFSGPAPAAIAEIFPTRFRTTGVSVGYSLSVAIFGGFAPLMATLLIARTGSPASPGYYLVAAAIVSTVTIALLPETANRRLQ